MINKQFGRKLKMLRQSHHISAPQVAGMLDITSDAYQELEAGVHGVRLDMLGRIARVFNITVAELLKGVEDL